MKANSCMDGAFRVAIIKLTTVHIKMLAMKAHIDKKANWMVINKIIMPTIPFSPVIIESIDAKQ